MVFPEHMEFRYYITPERKEHFVLYDRTLGSRMTYLELTQDLGQCLIDLYDTDFYDAYCVLSEINKLVQTEKNDAAWTEAAGAVTAALQSASVLWAARKGAERAGIGIRARSGC